MHIMSHLFMSFVLQYSAIHINILTFYIGADYLSAFTFPFHA